MIGGLANLSKTIDSLISGIIEFAYAIVSTIARAYVSPLKGALRSRVLKNNVSSKTLLFLTCSATIAYLSYGATEIGGVLSGVSPSLLGFVTIVILFYVAADICVVLLSFIYAQRNRKRARARDLLRYNLASVVGGWVLVFALLFYIDEKFISPGEIWGNFFLIVKFAPYIAIALAYPLFVVIFLLRRNRGAAPAPNVAITAVLGMAPLLVLFSVLYVQPRAFVDSVIAGGSTEENASSYAPEVVGFSCEAHRDKATFEIRAAVYNSSAVPIVLDKRTVHARVFQRGENDKASFSIEFPRAGQPLATIGSKSVSVIAFDQPIDERMGKAFVGTPVCSVYTSDEEGAPVQFVEHYPEGAVVEYGDSP